MGRKIHPTGFRLGITKEHKSNWCSSFRSYSELLKQDNDIRSYIEKNYENASISFIEISRKFNGKQIQIDIHTAKPGIIIGQGATGIQTLSQNLNKFADKDTTFRLNIIEIKNPFCNATLLAEYISSELENRVSFKRAMQNAVAKVDKSTIKGVKIQVAGRLNGAEIARSEWFREGRVPLQTLRADIDYSAQTALTIYGILGIKVWLFKGEVL
jgi:small subunit ribosomal protein S3